METKYILAKEPNEIGVRFVHVAGCPVAPEDGDALGSHENCEGAMPKAREIFDSVDGCALCCSPCHEMKHDGADVQGGVQED